MFFFFFLSNLLTDLQWNCVRVWFLTHEILLFCQKLHHKKRSTGESPPGYWDIIISSSSILSKIINLSIISTSISIRINISISISIGISIFPAQLLDSDVKQSAFSQMRLCFCLVHIPEKNISEPIRAELKLKTRNWLWYTSIPTSELVSPSTGAASTAW